MKIFFALILRIKPALKLFVFILTLIISSEAFSQESESRTIDWENLQKSSVSSKIAQPVKWGTFTIFTIKNINKFLFKVEIAGDVFELQTPVPTELQALFRLSPKELQQATSTVPANKAINQSDSGLKNIDEAVNTIGETGESNEFLIALTELQKAFNDYAEILKEVSTDLLSLKQSRNKLITIAQKDLPASAIAEEANAINLNPGSIEEEYNSLKDKFMSVSEKLSSAQAVATSDPEKASLLTISSNLKNSDALIKEEDLLNILNDVDFLKNELVNPNNFIVNAPPVQMDGDLISYDVKITPSVTRTLGPYRNPMEFKFDIPAKGGLKVDFSVGPSISFGKNSRDELYYLKETNSADTVLLKSRSNNNIISPGIAAFMHAYSRGINFTSIGAVFGVGTGFQNTSDVNLSLYFGITGVIGKTQRIMLNSGISYLRVERIKNDEFEENQKYSTSSLDLANVTEKVFKPSFFLSISYNLTNRVHVVK